MVKALNKLSLRQVFLHSLFLLIVSLFFFCKGKQGDPGPTGPSGPTLSGSITGLVALSNIDGTQPSNKSGVVVKTNKGDSTVTDSAGAWSLTEVTGVYNITFSKATYGTTSLNAANFSGGGATNDGITYLSQAPSYYAYITLDSIGGSSSTTKDLKLNVNFTITSTTSQLVDREFFVYYSTNQNVSSATGNYMGILEVSIPAKQTSFTASLPGATLNSAGIYSGEVVYAVAYSSSAAEAESSRSYDASTGKYNYTSLGPVSTDVAFYTVPH